MLGEAEMQQYEEAKERAETITLPRSVVYDVLHVLGDSDLGKKIRAAYVAQTKEG